jgi:CRISPR-associated protein Cas1
MDTLMDNLTAPPTDRPEAPAFDPDMVLPVRMCNELVYCPRLFHIEHVQGLFVESADTIRGAGQHDRAARRSQVRKKPSAPITPDLDPWQGLVPRALDFESATWGIRGRLDMLELAEDSAVVIEAKHGSAPNTSEHRWGEHPLLYRAWPADVVQVGLYIALLRDQGIRCDEARLYYRGNDVHTVIDWSDALERCLRDVVQEARRVALLEIAPDPLLDSPKCFGCSLHGICLPDEHYALKAAEPPLTPIRRIIPSREHRTIVHVTSPGTMIRKESDALILAGRDGEAERLLLKDVCHVAIYGPSQITSQCLQHLLIHGVPVSHHTSAGRLLGISAPLTTQNIGLRRAQYRAADDPERCLYIARALVLAKIRNQRTILKRYRRGIEAALDDEGGELPNWAVPAAAEGDDNDEPTSAYAVTAGALAQMQHALRAAERDTALDVLRGHEGEAAAAYFSALPAILPAPWRGDFCGRSRRPPRDRVNALISFGYSLLVRDTSAALARIGLDPMLGFFHAMLPGRPALALDLMEPFRAAWVDAAVLRLLATNGIDRADFHVSTSGVVLTDSGRNALIAAYERRADELTTHPRFGYRMSYRRLLELEARVLGKWLIGEIDAFTPLWTR